MGQRRRDGMAPLLATPEEMTASEVAAAIVRTCEYGIYSEDLDGVITTWNAAASEMFGYTAEDMVGTSSSRLLPDDLLPAHDELLQRIRRGRSMPHFETERLCKDGSTVLVALTITPIRSAAGEIVGSGTVARDIRDRKRVEAQLRRSSHYTRSLIEANLDPVVTISAHGKITDVNAATAVAVGLGRARLLGSDFCDYFTDPEQARLAYQSAFDNGAIRDFPLTIKRTDGKTADVLLNASVYRDMNGKIAGVFAAARDITALKRAQAELERSNAELEQFAYAASHDLAEPLRAISGPISLVANRYRGKLDPQAEEFMAFAVDGCARMQQLIHDLLAYSRVGRLEEPERLVDTAVCVRQAIDSLSAAMSESGAAVTVGELPVLTAEPSQLVLVFQNLLSNAVKFVAAGTRPTVEVAARREGDWWRFTITDNGIGIDRKHREAIFRMFKRLHLREDYPGTGIGLALAKKIVERHGGSIGVESGPAGVGTCVWFTVPAEPESPA